MGCGNSKGSMAVENQTGPAANTNNHQTGEQPGKVMNGPDKNTQEQQDSNKHIEDQQNTDSSPKEEIVQNGEEKKDAEKPESEETAPEQTQEQEETKPVSTEEESAATQAAEDVAQSEEVKQEEEVKKEEEEVKKEEEVRKEEEEVTHAEEVTQAEEVTEPATEGSTEEPAAPAAEETEEKPAEEQTEVTGNEDENPLPSDSNELQLDEDSAVDLEIQAVESHAQAEEEEEANTEALTESPKQEEHSAVNEPVVPSNDDDAPSSPCAETEEHKDMAQVLSNDTEKPNEDNDVAVMDNVRAASDEPTATNEDTPVTEENKDQQAEGGEGDAVEAVPEATSVDDARGTPLRDEAETAGEG